MVKVRATDRFVKDNVADGEINRIRLYGEEWEVNESRAKLLVSKGYCVYVEEPKTVEVELPEKETEVQEPKKRGRKKKS